MQVISPLISIIMPAYNAELYIGQAIDSVLKQNHENWELLVVNNNSSDGTLGILQAYTDPRIQVMSETKQGVSHARNLAISKMNGDYFCFLDADDIFPTNSLSSRLQVFQENTELSFVDGSVQYVDQDLNKLEKTYTPDFRGYPMSKLLRLDDRCLFGPSWMIKRDKEVTYSFDTSMTHAEDLFFYLSICRNKLYGYTSDTILSYRQSPNSAMKNLKGLEAGYILLIKNVKSKICTRVSTILILKLIITKIMVLSFLFDGRDLKAAVKTPFKVLWS